MIINRQVVFDYIEKNKDAMVEYLKDMVSIPSINCNSGGNEKEVQDWLAGSLETFNLGKIDRFAVDDKKIRPNVVVRMKGDDSGKSIIFNGHMDVVPVAKPDSWCCDPFKPLVRDGKVFGRGTSDMKGGICSAIWAMKSIKDCGIKLKGDVILQAVTGEESNQAEEIGTVQCLKRGYTADFGIVCEPTDLELHISSVALFMFELIVEGKAVHTSSRNQVLFPQPGNVPCGPEIGVDAFKKSLIYVNYFYSLESQWNQRWRDPILGTGGKIGHDVQGVGNFTINTVYVEAGQHQGVPSIAKYLYSAWYPDQIVKKEEIWEEIRNAVKALSLTDDFLRENPPVLKIPVLQDWAGFRVSENEPGVIAMMDTIPKATLKPAVMSGFKAVCDATYLNKYSVPSVVFGPGSLSFSVHGDDEYIPIKSMVSAAKVYASMLIDWCC